jgi:TolA-binding protein
MAFLRQSFLVLAALILGGGIYSAAGSTKEQRDYDAAAGAFHIEFWSRAEAEFTDFAQKYPTSTNAPEAVLLAAQAEFKQGEFTNAIALLTDAGHLAVAGTLADQYAYWTGEARFQMADYSGAAETWIALAQNFSGSPLRLRAVVEAAAAYVQSGDWPETIKTIEETNGGFQRAAQLDPGNELVLRGQLLLAQAKFALNDLGGATAVLNLISSQTLPPELDWQRAHLLYQVNFAAGDLEEALAAATNMLQIAPSEKDRSLHAESVAMRAAALKKLGRVDEAIAAYQENLTNNAPEEQQREAILKIAELSIAQGRFADAELKLGNFLARFTNSPAAETALFTLGELYLKDYAAQPAAATNQLPEAQKCFDQFLGAFTNSPLIGQAHLDRGWCEWLAEEFSDGFGDFKAAAEKLPPSEALAVARFKMGDALFALTNYAGALTNYHAVLDDFSAFPTVVQTLGDRALHQSLRADLELGDLTGASNVLAQISKNDSTGEPAQTGGLLLGESLLDLRSPADARAQFEKIEAEFPGSPLLPQVKLAVAQTYEAEQKWDVAIEKYKDWLKEFPASPLQPQVDYSLALANFQAGDETNAFDLFTNFVAQFPADELAPPAQWWVADYFYRAGLFVNAEKNYKLIFQNTNWQNSPLVYPAQLMAERAAIGWSGYTDARDLFAALVADTNCPPDLSAQARFVWGGALMQMPADTNSPLANYQKATNVFSQIIQSNPTNEISLLAWGEIGDCNLQLSDYGSATNAYAQVFNSPFADISARSEAQVATGIALEKMAAAAGTNQVNLQQQALNDYYLKVFDTWTGKNLRAGETADPFWVKKAGLQALPLVETLGTGNPDKFIDQMEALFPQSKDSLEKIRAALPSQPPPAKN